MTVGLARVKTMQLSMSGGDQEVELYSTTRETSITV
jgi:hypothetical protein